MADDSWAGLGHSPTGAPSPRRVHTQDNQDDFWGANAADIDARSSDQDELDLWWAFTAGKGGITR